jgi:hypothetical protein
MRAIQDACADRTFLTLEDLQTVAGYVRIFSEHMQRLVEKRLKVRSTPNKYGYSDTSGGAA